MLVKHTGTDEVVRNKVVGNDFRFKDKYRGTYESNTCGK